MAKVFSLFPRHSPGNHDIPKVFFPLPSSLFLLPSVRVGGKRQHVGRFIDSAESPVQGFDFCVGQNCNAEKAAGRSGRNPTQPAIQTLRIGYAGSFVYDAYGEAQPLPPLLPDPLPNDS